MWCKRYVPISDSFLHGDKNWRDLYNNALPSDYPIVGPQKKLYKMLLVKPAVLEERLETSGK